MAALAPSMVRRLTPATAVRTLTGLAVFGAVASGWALVLIAIGGLGRIDELQAQLHSNPVVVDSLDSVPRLAGALAAVVFAAMVVNTLRTGVAIMRDRRRITQALAGLPGGQLVVLHDAYPDAYAAPGGRIVVSTGLLTTLNAHDRRVLLAHERAHQRYHHARYPLAAELAAALNPALRALHREVEFGVERWADEHAATHTGRTPTARARARAALTTTSFTPPAGPVGALGYLRHHLADRVAALLAPEPVTRWVALTQPLTLATLVAVALLDATGACGRLLRVLWQ